MPTPSSLLPHETIVWEPEPIRLRTSTPVGARGVAKTAVEDMRKEPTFSTSLARRSKSPQRLQPPAQHAPPQPLPMSSQSHLPMKLRMKNLAAQPQMEPPFVPEPAQPAPSIDLSKLQMPSGTVVCEPLRMPPLHDAVEGPSQLPVAEAAESTPKPKLLPPERPIMTVRPMVKAEVRFRQSNIGPERRGMAKTGTHCQYGCTKVTWLPNFSVGQSFTNKCDCFA